MRRKRLVAATAAALVALMVAGVAVLIRQVFFAPKTITAYFTTAVAIYPGDEVRVAGVGSAGSPRSNPRAHRRSSPSRSTTVCRSPPTPKRWSSRKASSPPAMFSSPRLPHNGPTMADGAVIPIDAPRCPSSGTRSNSTRPTGHRTRTPQRRLGDVGVTVHRQRRQRAGRQRRQIALHARPAVRGRADAGQRRRQHRRHHQEPGRRFVDALRDSNTQIVQFEDRLATLTSVLDNNRSDLDAALRNSPWRWSRSSASSPEPATRHRATAAAGERDPEPR